MTIDGALDDLPQASTGHTVGKSSAPIRRDKVRLVMFLYRKQGMSPEEFSDYWRETHSHLFAGLAIVKKNLLKYEQVHTNHEGLALVKEAGVATADYDGMSILEAVSYKKIMEIFQDDEYLKKIPEDLENFVDRQKAVAYPASIVTVFSDPS